MQWVCCVCLSNDGYKLSREPVTIEYFNVVYDCTVCGKFLIDQDHVEGKLSDQSSATRRDRASLSHFIRRGQLSTKNTVRLTDEILKSALNGELDVLNPAQTASAIVNYFGINIQKYGEKIRELPVSLVSEIGATSRESVLDIMNQLKRKGILSFVDTSDSDVFDAIDIDLTLEGWNYFQAELSGKISADYGFLAMKFGEEELERLVADHLKPAISDVGFKLVDMRDVAEPGIIDNIMRMRIRDANFVIVDLTHDNSGAYWEAGYAEGLGKPVLYICNKEKFDKHTTHFDTNHCTTIMWNSDDPGQFCTELISTLSRSLK